VTDFDKNTEGELRPTGRLVAVKIPAAPPVIEINTHDSIGLPIKEKAILHGTGDQTEAVRVSDSEGISSAADVTESGAISQAVSINKGRTPQNEQGSEEVCRTLIERLNLSGYTIDPATLKPVEEQNDDTDFVAQNGNDKVRFQVTRAAPTRSFWRLLSTFRKQDHQWANTETCAEGIREAIEQKARKITTVSQRGGIILAIDAIHSPALALNETIRMFRRKYGAWASGLQFRSIWVVGPVSSVTHCVSISE
jgi:hypothetical protein